MSITAPKAAALKLLTIIPSRIEATNQKRSMFMRMPNNPRLKMLKGMLRILIMGLIVMLIKAKRITAMIPAREASIKTPSTK